MSAKNNAKTEKAAKSNGDTFADTQGLLKATLQQLSGF